jgi:large subunit ribosomal protein L13
MTEAFRAWMGRQQGVIGIISAGGSGGTAMATAGMQVLPVGVPKLMVSTMTSGNVAAYVGATDIAMILMGKHRPTYTPHVDTGDHVVVINADKVEFSGKKWQQKIYRWYTGYQGLKTETAEHRRDRRPELIVEEAVRRMLPKTRLGRKMLDKLKVYAGSEHPHQPQRPEPMEMGA